MGPVRIERRKGLADRKWGVGFEAGLQSATSVVPLEINVAAGIAPNGPYPNTSRGAALRRAAMNLVDNTATTPIQSHTESVSRPQPRRGGPEFDLHRPAVPLLAGAKVPVGSDASWSLRSDYNATPAHSGRLRSRMRGVRVIRCLRFDPADRTPRSSARVLVLRVSFGQQTDHGRPNLLRRRHAAPTDRRCCVST
jgi:hypothetical protein